MPQIALNFIWLLWPWPLTPSFVWTFLLTMVLNPKNSMAIWRWEHGQNDVTDGWTHKTDGAIQRAAWSFIIIFIFRLRCCPCPTLWGWQHQESSDTSPPSISILWVNTSQATVADISVHTFRPCLPRPSLFTHAGNCKVCDWFNTWLDMATRHGHTILVANSGELMLYPWCLVSREASQRICRHCAWRHRSNEA